MNVVLHGHKFMLVQILVVSKQYVQAAVNMRDPLRFIYIYMNLLFHPYQSHHKELLH